MRIRWISTGKMMPLIGIAGILLRLRLYLENLPLNNAEAVLALPVIHQSFSGMSVVSGHMQSAATGFLWIQKMLITVFGPQEYVLRFFPFFCGVVSLFIFWRFVSRILSPSAAVIAFIFFSCLDFFVRTACLATPASADLLTALILTSLTTGLATKDRISVRVFLTMILSGIVTIWLSRPSEGLLVVSIISLAIVYGIQKKRRLLFRILIIAVLWWFALMVYRLICLAGQNQGGFEYWMIQKYGLILVPVTIPAGWAFWEKIAGFISGPSTIFMGIVMLNVFAGLIVFFKEKRHVMLLWLAQIILFYGLVWITPQKALDVVPVLAPIMLGLMAEGTALITMRISKSIGACMIVMMLLTSIAQAFSVTASQLGEKDGTRALIRYYKTHRQPGDWICAVYGPNPIFQYYSEQSGILTDGKIMNRYWPPNLNRKFHAFSEFYGHGRVWLYFDNLGMVDGFNQRYLLTRYLAFKAQFMEEEIETGQGGLYLYRFFKLPLWKYPTEVPDSFGEKGI